MTAAEARAGEACAVEGRDAWVRLLPGWHAASWLVLGLTAVWALTRPGLEARQRVLCLGLLAVLGATYLVTVQRRPLTPRPATRAYLAVAITVAGVGCAVDPAFSMLLFLLYAQAWMLSGGLREGTAWSVLLSLSVLAGFLTAGGWSAEALRTAAPPMLVGLLLSLLLGFWISRIIEQSRERADLIAELERARAELAEVEHARGVVTERERLSREIHDTLAQGFTSVVMLAQTAAELVRRDPDRATAQLATIEDVARENLAEARALVAASAPAGLDRSPLPDAVRRLAARFARETGIDVDVDVDPLHHRDPLDPDRQVVVVRTVQEALANVRRHARARHVAVLLRDGGDGVVVAVRDDGVGFAPGEGGHGYGLAGLRTRAREVGGELDVASTPGGGTSLTLRLPAGGPADGP